MPVMARICEFAIYRYARWKLTQEWHTVQIKNQCGNFRRQLSPVKEKLQPYIKCVDTIIGGMI